MLEAKWTLKLQPDRMQVQIFVNGSCDVTFKADMHSSN